MKKPSYQQLVYVLAVAVAVLLTLAAVLTWRACQTPEVVSVPLPEVPAAAIEAKASAQAAQVARENEEKIQQLERQNAEALRTFTNEQEAQYEEVREQGPKEVAKWLSEFNRSLKKKPAPKPKP